MLLAAIRGDINGGWVAVDDFEFLDDVEDCSIVPPEADPYPKTSTDAGGTTSQYYPPSNTCSIICTEILKLYFSAKECNFESNDFCDFSVAGFDNFNFTIKQGFSNADEGPLTDGDGNEEGHFAFINTHSGVDEGSVTMIETGMINAQDHLIECFTFNFAIKKDGGLRSISVIQQDQELEDGNNIELVWFYSSEQVSSDAWVNGSLEVRAHYHDDVPQNYTVR